MTGSPPPCAGQTDDAIGTLRAAPRSDADPYRDDVLTNPYPLYEELRQVGDVVSLPRHDVIAVVGHQAARRALGDWSTFSSAHGVGISPIVNRATAGAVFTTDPPEHDPLRKPLVELLSASRLQEFARDARSRADQIVGRLVQRPTFDVVSDLAQPFALEMIARLIGLPEIGQDDLLRNSADAFDALGPSNERGRRGLAGLLRVLDYVERVAVPGNLSPGGVGDALYAEAKGGAIETTDCPSLLSAFVWAGLDTTSSSIGNSVSSLVEPGTWSRLRSTRALIPSAFEEAIRLESPVQSIARWTPGGGSIAGVRVPPRTRVVVFFGSANRDPRVFTRPTELDITRRPNRHLGFGIGVHRCAGRTLARILGCAALEAMVEHASEIAVVERTWKPNNVVRGLGRLSVEATPEPGVLRATSYQRSSW